MGKVRKSDVSTSGRVSNRGSLGVKLAIGFAMYITGGIKWGKQARLENRRPLSVYRHARLEGGQLCHETGP